MFMTMLKNSLVFSIEYTQELSFSVHYREKKGETYTMLLKQCINMPRRLIWGLRVWGALLKI